MLKDRTEGWRLSQQILVKFFLSKGLKRKSWIVWITPSELAKKIASHRVVHRIHRIRPYTAVQSTGIYGVRQGL